MAFARRNLKGYHSLFELGTRLACHVVTGFPVTRYVEKEWKKKKKKEKRNTETKKHARKEGRVFRGATRAFAVSPGRGSACWAKEFLSQFRVIALDRFLGPRALASLVHYFDGERERESESGWSLRPETGNGRIRRKLVRRSSVHRALILCPGNGIPALNPFALASAAGSFVLLSK